mmetsp:Transcript_51983/g.105901  ORF Transcript_51983/g.105901 Transcript_51983/m.105901 type:complete len:167 (-) Transcript_51983:230-730(-)
MLSSQPTLLCGILLCAWATSHSCMAMTACPRALSISHHLPIGDYTCGSSWGDTDTTETLTLLPDGKSFSYSHVKDMQDNFCRVLSTTRANGIFELHPCEKNGWELVCTGTSVWEEEVSPSGTRSKGEVIGYSKRLPVRVEAKEVFVGEMRKTLLTEWKLPPHLPLS